MGWLPEYLAGQPEDCGRAAGVEGDVPDDPAIALGHPRVEGIRGGDEVAKIVRQMGWIPVEFVDKPCQPLAPLEVHISPNSNVRRNTIRHKTGLLNGRRSEHALFESDKVTRQTSRSRRRVACPLCDSVDFAHLPLR